jgi:hypothetical protein
MTFHTGEKNELEDITENIEPKIVWPTKNHPPKLQRVKTKSKNSWELIWDHIEKKYFWYHETRATSPYARERKIDQL